MSVRMTKVLKERIDVAEREGATFLWAEAQGNSHIRLRFVGPKGEFTLCAPASPSAINAIRDFRGDVRRAIRQGDSRLGVR